MIFLFFVVGFLVMLGNCWKSITGGNDKWCE